MDHPRSRPERNGALLITGASGFIGGHLAVRASGNWTVCATYHRTGVDLKGAQEVLPMDVTNPESVRSAIRTISPKVVIHCAAITSMDYCAYHATLASEVNVKGTKNISAACEEVGARMIYMSTDLVFDGLGRFYSEEDTPNPICVYGKTKYAGEEVVSSLNKDYCIVRAAWTFGRSVNTSECFAERMIAKLSQGTPVALFSNEYRTPIHVSSLCDAILELAGRRDTGIYHLAGPQRVSRHEFGLMAVEVFGFDATLISGSTVDAFGFRDSRPRDCSLSSRKATNALLTQFLSIRAGLRKMSC